MLDFVDTDFERGDTLGVEVVMRKFLSLAVMCSLAFPAMALAQPEAPKEAAADMEAAPAAEAGTEEAIMAMPEPPKVAMDDMAAEEPAEGESWKDGIDWMVMASAFYRVGGYIGDGVLAGPYNNVVYPYTNYNGFGLNFVGGDFQYTGEKFALRIDLRFGEGAALLTPISAAGFGGLKQGYVSWMPSDKVSIDVGFFDTIFGGEVVDEWNNANYTRGALYFNRQPFNHMGLRSAFSLSDQVGMTLMVTNGGVLGGTPVDGNETPTLGWQFSISDKEENVGFFFGGQHGAANPNDNKNWEQFFDWVLSASAGVATIVLNGDYQLTPTAVSGGTSSAFAYGHSLQLTLDATDKIAFGIRGEHLSGNEQQRLTSGQPYLATATLTLRYKPVQYLVITLEGRGEWTSAADRIYYSRAVLNSADPSVPDKRHNYAAILGFTAYINN